MAYKKCPKCFSNQTKKNGTKKGIQRYKCKRCNTIFQSIKKRENFRKKLWQDYVKGNQTYNQLAKKHKVTTKTIKENLDKIKVSTFKKSIHDQLY